MEFLKFYRHLIFRADDYFNHGELYLGYSKDGGNFTLEDKSVEFIEEMGLKVNIHHALILE